MAALIIALLEHPEDHEAFKACFERAGHAVLVVSSFQKAKAILKEHLNSFDMIVSDVHLENGGTVFDFLQWAKKSPKLHSIPFVLLSVKPSAEAKYLEDGVRTAARFLGAAKYVSMDKLDPDVLAQEIAELLPNKAAVPIVATEGE